MEFALVIGAFVAIIVLIALCTFWFFNLHRSFLVVEAELEVQRTAEDRGEKLLLTTGNLDHKELRLKDVGATTDEKMKAVGAPLSVEDQEKHEVGTGKAERFDVTVKSQRVAMEDEGVEKDPASKKKIYVAEKPEIICYKPNPGEAAPEKVSEGGDRLMDPLVRAEVVIGEGTKQLLIETNVTLERAAIKIRNITAEIRNLTTELIQDKIIIQGILHKQIFFVGEDNIVHHQAEDVPFSTFIDIFGTEPGMNVQVHPVIETILFSLIRPTLLHQKVVVEIFVKVTESNQLNLVEGAGPLVRLDQVIGEGTKQELIENTVGLNTPALKIDDITAEIRDLTIEVIDDKVIIQGIVHKQIFFIGLDNIEYHQAEDLEFSTFLDIPGATTGMDVVAEPTIEFIHFELLDEDTLLQKVVIEFFVKVTESIQINVVLGPGALLKLDTVVGEDTKQLLVENTIVLSQPAIKIREIVARVERLMAEVIEDKVIIQGIVHKQIFFINEDNLEIHQSEDVPFSTFVDIPGAVPGMDVRIKPIIETVLFELLNSTTLRQKVVVELFIKVTESQQLQVLVASPYGPYYF